jgi:hypothetical protein
VVAPLLHFEQELVYQMLRSTGFAPPDGQGKWVYNLTEFWCRIACQPLIADPTDSAIVKERRQTPERRGF